MITTPSPSRLALRNILSCFYKLSRKLSIYPEILFTFLSNFYIPPCVGKISKFMEFTFLENALIRSIFTHAHLHSKLASKFLSSRPRQNEITHSPRHHSSENLFPQIAERGGENYDFLCQHSVRKYEDDLEH